jgi:hypothetical protein
VELLVAMAIIGVLVALLLPAVMSSRDRAHALECRNRLRQIGVAMHADPPHFHFRSMLDRLEQKDAPREQPLVIFRCPVDRGSETISRSEVSGVFGRSNYAGVTGDGESPGFYRARRIDPARWPDELAEPVGIESVSDGLSSTLAVGERDSEPVDPLAAWHFMPGVSCRLPLNSVRANGEREKDCFRSLHRDQGAHFLMGDGAVRFVQEGIDLALYHALSTSQSGDVVSEF